MSRIILAACTFGFAFTVAAESRPLDAYKSIVDRNPFGLKDPPTVVVKDPTPQPVVKKEDFYLTGISTIGNPKRPKAYLVAKDASKKEYDQKFFNLSVGDRQGDVMLQEIDAKGRRVKIAYLGEEKWLSMKDNGVPAPSGPAVPGIPGAPMAPGMGAPGAVPVPLPLPTPGMAPAQRSQPITYPNANNTRRSMRTAGTTITPPNYGQNFSAPGTTVGTVGVPNVNANTGEANAPAVPQGPQTDADVAAQIINMHANRQYQLQQGLPSPPLPMPPMGQ